ncbi:hypothetical protein BGW38_000987 [Lunasporangiospora selenospora]|uniref:START domain-containing protein n=1 Tax=Lunasporangiospora selenospora TaxID=979761 RepID=A0A9P6KIX2_9FUNG|nr:hypothetical protein BGW38_000987 [Lunasporangiospora selenospora]
MKKGLQGIENVPPEVLSDHEIEWTGQHHLKTMGLVQSTNNLTKTNLHSPGGNNIISNTNNNATMGNNLLATLQPDFPFQHNNLSNSGFDYPLSGDESDHPHNLPHHQMEHFRSQFYTPDPQKRTREYHMEQAAQAVELLKTASRSTDWKKVDKHKSGCVAFQSTSTLHPAVGPENKYPAFKGEQIIRGYKAQDILAIVNSRKLWDDWYNELDCVESYDDSTSLMYMVMKGTMSSKPRDISMVERIEVDRDGSIYVASCSVDSPKVPRVSGKVRAEIFIAGWVIQPLPSNPPITRVTYVVQTDLLGKLPKFISKRSMAKRAMVISIVEAQLRKNSSPIVAVSNHPTNSRPRSLSEPLKLDKLLLPQDSDDDLPSADAFMTPLDAYRSGDAYEEYAESSADEDEPRIPYPLPRLQPRSALKVTPNATPKNNSSLGVDADASSVARTSLISSNSLFTQEFLDSSSFLGDSSDLFSSAPLFGQTSFTEPPTKQNDSPTRPAEPRTPVTQSPKSQPQNLPLASLPTPLPPPPLPSTPRPPTRAQSPRTNPQQTQQQDSTTKQQQKTVPQDKKQPSEATTKQKSTEQETRKTLINKRVSIPVVLPKSEARGKQNVDSISSASSQSSDQSLLAPSNALTTPPLTPPASVDGKDGASDSDVSAIPEVKVVPRSPKKVAPSEDLTPSSPGSSNRPSSMMFSTLGVKSPSEMMEARRHSILLASGGTIFAPRYSNAIPIRGNPNVSLQSLTRPSGPMSNSMKRHSTAPSMDSTRSTTFTPVMVLPHRHSETARKALAMFKVLASSPEDRWRTIASESGFKSYSRIISGAGLPMLRGEGTITGGWTVEQINAVIESAGCRQHWDERFENLSIAETFNHNEYLFHVTLRGVGSMTGRDLAGVTIIDRDPQTSALYNVSTSVIDPTIPEDPGRIRAMLELSGWSLRPTFDGQGNTVSVNVTYVIQIDVRGNLPTTVVRQMTSSMTTAASRLNQFINKTGYPPFSSHISGTRLLDTFDPKTGFYELCYKASPGWTEVRVGRKVYKNGYDFFIKPDDPSVKVELAPDFGGVRVWTTLDHEGQSIIAQVSRKGENSTESKEEEKAALENSALVKSEGGFKSGYSQSELEGDNRHSHPTSRKRRSASYQTVNSTAGSSRPDSQASIVSRSSQVSEKGRTRGRARTIVALPAGAPPPPLPRRSSSLTRYSIPIAPYLAEADAPPVPINTAVTRSSIASTLDQSPITPRSPALSSTPTAMRPLSQASMASPTLGPFHVPHTIADVPPLENAATPSTPPPSDSKALNTLVMLSGRMESITTVLSDSTPATPVPMTTFMINTGSITEAPVTVVSTLTAEAVANPETVVTTAEETTVLKSSAAKEVESNINESPKWSKLGSVLLSPVNSPVPSPMPEFGPRSSSLPTPTPSPISTPLSSGALVLPTLVANNATVDAPSIALAAAKAAAATANAFAVAGTQQPIVSSLKQSGSMSSGSGLAARRRDVRVTFSLDTIDKSSSIKEKEKEVLAGSPTTEETPSSAIRRIRPSSERSVRMISSKETIDMTPSAAIMEDIDSDSSDVEFVEAEEEIFSDEEIEFAFMLASVAGAWPLLAKSSMEPTTAMKMVMAQKKEGEELVEQTVESLVSGYKQLTGSTAQFKVAVVFMLLVYYAGRLSSFVA